MCCEVSLRLCIPILKIRVFENTVFQKKTYFRTYSRNNTTSFCILREIVNFCGKEISKAVRVILLYFAALMRLAAILKKCMRPVDVFLPLLKYGGK